MQLAQEGASIPKDDSNPVLNYKNSSPSDDETKVLRISVPRRDEGFLSSDGMMSLSKTGDEAHQLGAMIEPKIEYYESNMNQGTQSSKNRVQDLKQ